jgi:hypothetical protein
MLVLDVMKPKLNYKYLEIFAMNFSIMVLACHMSSIYQKECSRTIMYIYYTRYLARWMSISRVNTAIYAMILTIGAMFIPLQFGYANTSNLQSVISHTCDQSHIVAGCGNGASYRAVQNTLPDTNSSSGDESSGSATICPSDRRHECLSATQ